MEMETREIEAAVKEYRLPDTYEMVQLIKRVSSDTDGDIMKLVDIYTEARLLRQEVETLRKLIKCIPNY